MYKYHRIWFCVPCVHSLKPNNKKLSDYTSDSCDERYFDCIFNYELNDIIKSHPNWELLQVEDRLLSGKDVDGYAIFREKIEECN